MSRGWFDFIIVSVVVLSRFGLGFMIVWVGIFCMMLWKWFLVLKCLWKCLCFSYGSRIGISLLVR